MITERQIKKALGKEFAKFLAHDYYRFYTRNWKGPLKVVRERDLIGNVSIRRSTDGIKTFLTIVFGNDGGAINLGTVRVVNNQDIPVVPSHVQKMLNQRIVEVDGLPFLVKKHKTSYKYKDIDWVEIELEAV